MSLQVRFLSLLAVASTLFGCQDLIHSDITISKGTTILYFYAPGCQACEMMKDPMREVIPHLIKKYGVAACYRINVSGAGAEIADDFNIRSVPTFIIMHKVDAVHDTADGLRNALEPLMKTIEHDAAAEKSPGSISPEQENLLDERDTESFLTSHEEQPESVAFTLHDADDAREHVPERVASVPADSGVVPPEKALLDNVIKDPISVENTPALLSSESAPVVPDNIPSQIVTEQEVPAVTPTPSPENMSAPSENNAVVIDEDADQK